jgi:hypothetical protein
MICALFFLKYEETLRETEKIPLYIRLNKMVALKNTDFYDEEKDGTAALV